MPIQVQVGPRFFVFIATSVDGYIAGSEGDLDWLSCVDKAGEDYGFAAFMERIDTLLLGRNTYDAVLGMKAWPYAGKSCFVVTHRPVEASRYGVEFVSGSTDAIVAALRQAEAQSVYVDGGQLIQQWLDAGLVDEITISIVPVLLGQGIRLFPGGFRNQALKLTRCLQHETGLVQLTYEKER